MNKAHILKGSIVALAGIAGSLHSQKIAKTQLRARGGTANPDFVGMILRIRLL